MWNRGDAHEVAMVDYHRPNQGESNAERHPVMADDVRNTRSRLECMEFDMAWSIHLISPLIPCDCLKAT